MRSTLRIAARALAAVSLAVAAGMITASRAERMEPLPPPLEGVGITEHPNALLPLDAAFTDEAGSSVVLGDYFRRDRPMILVLAYYRCPMLCTLVLNGLTDALRALEWLPGREFEVVTVSIDPTETSKTAGLKKKNYIESYGRPEAASGWHFLVGSELSIRRVAETVGFGYKLDPSSNEYAHTAAIYVVTPEGRLSRYLYGVLFDPRTVRLSLVEAADGRIGTTLDQLILYCYHYDATAGRYGPAAFRIMQLGGALTVVLLGSWLAFHWIREHRRRVA